MGSQIDVDDVVVETTTAVDTANDQNNNDGRGTNDDNENDVVATRQHHVDSVGSLLEDLRKIHGDMALLRSLPLVDSSNLI